MTRRSHATYGILIATSLVLALSLFPIAPAAALPAAKPGKIVGGLTSAGPRDHFTATDATGQRELTRPGRTEDVQTIACGQERAFSDENGRWQLRFQCLPEYGVINWHFNFLSKVQSIATSWATEDGLRWWRNGAEQPKNAPHFVPVDYTLHGTLSRVFVGDVIDYQDYITFRHNLGSGGTAAVTFAGSVRLV